MSWDKRSSSSAAPTRSAILTYDANGNRTAQSITGLFDGTTTTQTTTYTWDSLDRMTGVQMPNGRTFSYAYDYRTQRIGITEAPSTLTPEGRQTRVLFSGGLSVAEWEVSGSTPPTTAAAPSVEYTRGPDMGGGVGGLLYTRRSTTLKYDVSNGRGDIVLQTGQNKSVTWTASYEAFGKRTKETGTNADKQRANSKDEDPTGLLNEGFRYRDLESGVWLSRDPAGFVDGPNLYAYVKQNPWTGWDPHGLKVEVKRTRKEGAKAPEGMTSAQRSAWNRDQKNADHGSHTEITIRAALLDETSAGHTPEQIEAMRQGIVDSVNKAYTGKNGKDSWSMKLDLRIVKSAKDIQDDDHELILKDFVQAKNFAGSEFGGYALKSDKQVESGSLGLGGNTMVISMHSVNNNGVKLGPLSAHEFGHTMGLRHPDDKGNKFSRGTFKPDNLMWHKVPGSPAPVDQKQTDSIYSDYSGNKLNQGRSSISEADFYFSEAQYKRDNPQ